MAASKALAKLRAEVEEVKSRGRKALASAKAKLGDPKKAAIYVLAGVAIGFIGPKMAMPGKPADKPGEARTKRRYFRLLVGGALVAYGMKKNREALLVGIGILGSEALATGLEMAADKLGTGATEIGDMERGTFYRLPTASYDNEPVEQL